MCCLFVPQVWGQGTFVLTDNEGVLKGSLNLPSRAFFPEFLMPLEQQVFSVLEVLNTTTSTREDALIETRLSAWVRNVQMSYTQIRNPSNLPVVYAVEGEHATISESGLLSWVSDGSVDVTLTLGNFSATSTVEMASTASSELEVITGGVADSWRKAVTDPIVTMVASDGATNDRELFSTQDHTTLSFVRNLDSWAYDIAPAAAWSGVAVSSGNKEAGGKFIRGTLISPDVVAFSWHNRPAIGEELHWLGTDNTLYTRSVTARIPAETFDSGLGLLSAPLPAEVQPLKLLPADFQKFVGTYLSLTDHWQIPSVGVNQFNQASVSSAQYYQVNADGNTYRQWWYRPSYIATISPYAQAKIVGDSGQPAMLTDGAQLVLLSTYLTAIAGPSYVMTDNFLTLISNLGGTAPTAVDLSSYTNWVQEAGPPAP